MLVSTPQGEKQQHIEAEPLRFSSRNNQSVTASNESDKQLDVNSMKLNPNSMKF